MGAFEKPGIQVVLEWKENVSGLQWDKLKNDSISLTSALIEENKEEKDTPKFRPISVLLVIAFVVAN